MKMMITRIIYYIDCDVYGINNYDYGAKSNNNSNNNTKNINNNKLYYNPNYFNNYIHNYNNTNFSFFFSLFYFFQIKLFYYQHHCPNY